MSSAFWCLALASLALASPSYATAAGTGGLHLQKRQSPQYLTEKTASM